VDTNPAMERLVEVEHLAEVGRLLSIFRDLGRSSIGQRELIELALNTAGLSYRYPRPRAALAIAAELKLIVQVKREVRLSRLGHAFASRPTFNSTDISREQGKMLFALLLDCPSFRPHSAGVLRCLRRGEHDELYASPGLFIWNAHAGLMAKIMQQCGALAYHDELLFLDREFEALIPTDLFAPRGLSEEELYRRLETQRERAANAEELVVSLERKRVEAFGNPKLVEQVIRISTADVSAGYDVISVERDETPRFIEVKSSSGQHLRFEWSTGERRFAEENGDRYWIYFVPLAHIREARDLPVFMIQNPVVWIKKGALIEEATSWRVTDPFLSRLPMNKPWSESPLVEFAIGTRQRKRSQ
jgi:hypothetical protein